VFHQTECCDLAVDPSFPYSCAVVNRKGSVFVEKKTNRTSHLIKSFLQSLPAQSIDDAATVYWRLDDDRKLDSEMLSLARTSVSMVDPGLNSLFTGSQLRRTMKAMARRKNIRRPKCKSLIKFLMLPGVYIWRLVTSSIEVKKIFFACLHLQVCSCRDRLF